MKKLHTVIALSLCVLICFLLCSCSGQASSTKTDKIEFGDFDALDIEMLSENVKLNVVTDNSKNYVEYTVKEWGFVFGSFDIDVDESENTVRISRDDNGFSFFGGASADVNIYITKDSFSKLEVEMTSGKFSVTDKLSVDELSVGLTSGSCEIENIKAKHCEAEQTSGSTDISGELDSCDLGLTSGSMDVTSSVMPKELSGDVTSGMLKITMPDSNDGFSLDYDVTSGSIKSDFELSNYVGKEGIAKYKNGRGDYELDVTSGSISLIRANNAQ